MEQIATSLKNVLQRLACEETPRVLRGGGVGDSIAIRPVPAADGLDAQRRPTFPHTKQVGAECCAYMGLSCLVSGRISLRGVSLQVLGAQGVWEKRLSYEFDVCFGFCFLFKRV